MNDEILAYLPPGWLLIVATLMVTAFTASRLTEAYDGFAKVLGPLGRYWRNRAIKRQEELEARAKVLGREVAREIAYEVVPPDYEALRQSLLRVLERVSAMEEVEAINQAYLIEDAKWHLTVDVSLAERGVAVPPRLTYTEFAAKYKVGWRPGNK